jgi:hypothetical protein
MPPARPVSVAQPFTSAQPSLPPAQAITMGETPRPPLTPPILEGAREHTPTRLVSM